MSSFTLQYRATSSRNNLNSDFTIVFNLYQTKSFTVVFCLFNGAAYLAIQVSVQVDLFRNFYFCFFTEIRESLRCIMKRKTVSKLSTCKEKMIIRFYFFS